MIAISCKTILNHQYDDFFRLCIWGELYSCVHVWFGSKILPASCKTVVFICCRYWIRRSVRYCLIQNMAQINRTEKMWVDLVLDAWTHFIWVFSRFYESCLFDHFLVTIFHFRGCKRVSKWCTTKMVSGKKREKCDL